MTAQEKEIRLTEKQGRELKASIIKIMAGFSLTVFAGLTATGLTFYYKTTYATEQHTEQIKCLQQDMGRKANVEMILQIKEDLKNDMSGLKDDVKEVRNLLITKLK